MRHKPKYRVIKRSVGEFGKKAHCFVIQKKTWFGFYWDTDDYFFNEVQANNYCRRLNVGWIEDIFKKYGFNLGRMISASKSGYRKTYPDNLVIFNANIFTYTKHKVWYGDLDITKDAENLQKVCNEIGEEMIVVSEMKGRFGGEERKYQEISKTADVAFTPNSDYYEVLETDGLDSIKIGNMHVVIGKPKHYKKIKFN